MPLFNSRCKAPHISKSIIPASSFTCAKRCRIFTAGHTTCSWSTLMMAVMKPVHCSGLRWEFVTPNPNSSLSDFHFKGWHFCGHPATLHLQVLQITRYVPRLWYQFSQVAECYLNIATCWKCHSSNAPRTSQQLPAKATNDSKLLIAPWQQLLRDTMTAICQSHQDSNSTRLPWQQLAKAAMTATRQGYHDSNLPKPQIQQLSKATMTRSCWSHWETSHWGITCPSHRDSNSCYGCSPPVMLRNIVLLPCQQRHQQLWSLLLLDSALGQVLGDDLLDLGLVLQDVEHVGLGLHHLLSHHLASLKVALSRHTQHTQSACWSWPPSSVVSPPGIAEGCPVTTHTTHTVSMLVLASIICCLTTWHRWRLPCHDTHNTHSQHVGLGLHYPSSHHLTSLKVALSRHTQHTQSACWPWPALSIISPPGIAEGCPVTTHTHSHVHTQSACRSTSPPSVVSPPGIAEGWTVTTYTHTHTQSPCWSWPLSCFVSPPSIAHGYPVTLTRRHAHTHIHTNISTSTHMQSPTHTHMHTTHTHTINMHGLVSASILLTPIIFNPANTNHLQSC